MSTVTDGRHLTDAELIRVLDGHGPEVDDPGAARPDPASAWSPGTHLRACDRCARALATLREDSRLIRRILRDADFEEGGAAVRAVAPDELEARATGERRMDAASTPPHAAVVAAPTWLKAAAILVLVAGPLAAFPGVRAWVTEQVTGGSQPAGPTAEAVDPPTVIRFTPDPGDFVVTFEEGTAGTLRVDRAAGAEAELRAVGGDPEAVVGASSLRIRNRDAGRYELRLPGAVTGVWVRIGDRAVAVSGDQIDGRTVVDLDS